MYDPLLFQIYFVTSYSIPQLSTDDIALKLSKISPNSGLVIPLPGKHYQQNLKKLPALPQYKRIKSFWYLPKKKLFRVRLSNFPSAFYVDISSKEIESGDFRMSNNLRNKLKKVKTEYGI